MLPQSTSSQLKKLSPSKWLSKRQDTDTRRCSGEPSLIGKLYSRVKCALTFVIFVWFSDKNHLDDCRIFVVTADLTWVSWTKLCERMSLERS